MFMYIYVFVCLFEYGSMYFCVYMYPRVFVFYVFVSVFVCHLNVFHVQHMSMPA